MDALAMAVAEGTLIKVSLGAPRKTDAVARRLLARPVLLRDGPRLQVVWSLPTHDVTRNLEPDEGVQRLGELLGTEFCVANLFTTRRTAQLEFRKGRAGRVLYSPAVAPEVPTQAHDRVKARTVPADRPWLRALGVTTAEGAVCRGQESKYRQIHRFIELLDPLLVEAGLVREGAAALEGDPSDPPLRVWDMGCGKGHLTFALHEHLRSRSARPVRTFGVEARASLVAGANRAALESGCDGLEFLPGTIAEAPREAMDVLVALHACDTATDDALAAGISADAALLVVSPCCHREVQVQLTAPAVFAGALRHGILNSRMAEIVTDALRAGLLEWAGRDPRVFEFISPEHTAKNLMIAAVRHPNTDPGAAARRVRELAAAFGIRHQHLAASIGFPLGSPA